MAKTLKDLPVGSIITYAGAPIYNKPIRWMKLEDNHYGMNETTLIAKDIIKYMCVDAKEPRNSNSSRRDYGNNRYIHSNVHQWLNSDKASWYSDAHSSDQAPNKDNVYNGRNPYDNIPGFMNAWDRDFKEAILNTSLKVVKSSTDGGGMDTFNAKVFCLSRTEAGLGNESGADGTPFSYFDSDSRRKAVPTADAKANNDDSSDYAIWWLRTPSADHSDYVRSVYSDGSLDYNSAYYGRDGVRPALNFPSSISISEKGNGEYELTFNTPPKISGQDQDLGNISDGLDYTYTVFDEDNDTLSVIERLNNEVIQVRNTIKSGSEFTAQISKEKIYELPIGKRNTLQIEVSDGKERAYRNITFTRVNTAPIIEMISETIIPETPIAPELKFKVHDPEGDKTDVKIKLNGQELQTFEDIELDQEVTYKIPKRSWVTLDIGEHTITIDAIDEQAGESQAKIKVTKIEGQIKVTSGTLDTEIMVEQIIPIAWVNIIGVDVEQTTKILATNNANDEAPAWEDVTAEAIAGDIYKFKNTDKTADNWGVAVRAEIVTEGSEG